MINLGAENEQNVNITRYFNPKPTPKQRNFLESILTLFRGSKRKNRVFPTGGMRGESPHQPKICSSPPTKQQFSCYNPISHCSSTIFVLISYSLYTQVMLILILIVQYSQKTVFSFEKGSNCKNHSSSGSLHLVKKSPLQQNFRFSPTGAKSPPPLNAIRKTLKNLESIFIEIININIKNIVVGCVYCHPSMDANEFNEHYLSILNEKLYLEKNQKIIILMANFNINLLR